MQTGLVRNGKVPRLQQENINEVTFKKNTIKSKLEQSRRVLLNLGSVHPAHWGRKGTGEGLSLPQPLVKKWRHLALRN